jgi:hypothetical protein
MEQNQEPHECDQRQLVEYEVESHGNAPLLWVEEELFYQGVSQLEFAA